MPSVTITLTEKTARLLNRQSYRLDGSLDDVLARVGALLRQYPVEQYGTELQCLIWMGPERGWKAVVLHGEAAR